MEEATQDEIDNIMIKQLINDFTVNAEELAMKYDGMDSVVVYTALSVLICKLAVLEGMSAHTLMEGILKTYRKFEEEKGFS
jgi:hypothetical protein